MRYGLLALPSPDFKLFGFRFMTGLTPYEVFIGPVNHGAPFEPTPRAVAASQKSLGDIAQ